MGSSPFRIPGKPTVMFMHGYWWYRRAPFSPIAGRTVRELGESIKYAGTLP
jgi:hypothetical protein